MENAFLPIRELLTIYHQRSFVHLNIEVLTPYRA